MGRYVVCGAYQETMEKYAHIELLYKLHCSVETLSNQTALYVYTRP